MKVKRFKINFRSFGTRVSLLYLIFAGVIYVISDRLYGLQIVDYSHYKNQALAQQLNIVELEPTRGEIYLQDKDGILQPLAINKRFFDAAINPSVITGNRLELAEVLAAALDLPAADVLAKLNMQDDPYELLAKHLSEEKITELQGLQLPGLLITEDRLRYYPNEGLASQVVGFVGFGEEQREGKYGLESFYEDLLSGEAVGASQLKNLVDKFSLWSLGSASSQDGASLVLTLDPILQKETERLLKEEVEKWSAQSGNAIIMDPKTGALLALANYPDFNPNTYSKQKDLSVFMNGSVSLRYEPGSVFKPFTLAAGIESGKITPATEYYDSGEAIIDKHVIHNAGNAAPNKMISMSLFLQRSYNLGAVFVQNTVGDEYFRDFLLDTLGFAEKTGVDLPNEINNSFANFFPPEGRRINFANASFGQGIAITPLKLIQEFAAFANQGKVMRPYVVAEIRQPDGRREIIEPKQVRQGFSAKTAAQIVPLLEDVVSAEKGSGFLARIPGYRIAGKTGTGDIAREDGRGYSLDKINHTFVGFGPTSDARLIVLTRIEDPKGVRYAEATAVPLFRKIMKFALDYYSIPPDRPEELNK